MQIDLDDSKLINWETIKSIETEGETGANISREFNINNIRIRVSEYSRNYKTAELCSKGHIIHCIEGELIIQHSNGNDIKLTGGKTLILKENDAHIALTGDSPAKIFVID